MRVQTQLTVHLEKDERWKLEDSAYVYQAFMVQYHVETSTATVYARRQFNNGREATNGKPFFIRFEQLPERVQQCIVRNTIGEHAVASVPEGGGQWSRVGDTDYG